VHREGFWTYLYARSGGLMSTEGFTVSNLSFPLFVCVISV